MIPCGGGVCKCFEQGEVKEGWRYIKNSPEMTVAGGPVLHRVLLNLFRQVWGKGCVFDEWRDALVVPVPKRGDLNVCDNWRGISLVDVAGKLLGRILQERLQRVAERVLPDSQCAFCQGRGCVDMIFAARQLVEKARSTTAFFLHSLSI